MNEVAGSLRGQVALVSGASRGIGLDIAEGLVGAGARVAMLARGEEDLTSAGGRLGDAAMPLVCDVTEPRQVRATLDQVTNAWGPVELVVHNAGTAEVIGPLWEAEPEAWWEEATIHARGAMLLAHACLPSMLERGTGRIVLVYGNLGDRGEPWSTAYSVGKAGLLRLVGQLHSELDGTDIRVFGLHPGLVWTPMTAALAEEPDKQRWLPRFGLRDREEYGTGDTAAEMVVRIASGEADELSGLLVGAWDDLQQLSITADEVRASHRRTLRVEW